MKEFFKDLLPGGIRGHFKDLVESKAIYLIGAGVALGVVSIIVDFFNYAECRAAGWSVLWCLTKW